MIRAVPSTSGVLLCPEQLNLEASAPDCSAATGRVDDPCASTCATHLPPDHLAETAAAMSDPRIQVLDLTDAFCDDQTCHELIGGAVVYFDGSHLAATFSRSLGQFTDARIPT